jgi:hypothetical protein
MIVVLNAEEMIDLTTLKEDVEFVMGDIGRK